jgi:hypothetical protein
MAARPEAHAHATDERFNSAFSPIHMQAAIPEIDLSPSQGAEFSSPQAMPISE